MHISFRNLEFVQSFSHKGASFSVIIPVKKKFSFAQSKLILFILQGKKEGGSKITPPLDLAKQF